MKNDFCKYLVIFYKDYEFVKKNDSKVEHIVFEAFKDCKDNYFRSFRRTNISDVQFINIKKIKFLNAKWKIVVLDYLIKNLTINSC